MPGDRDAGRVLVAHAASAVALSLPWPLALVLVAEQAHDPLLLGLAGAARMLPYVALSWIAGRLADVVRRDLIVRLTLAARWLLLLGAAVAFAADRVWPGVACLTLAVAVSTPAYPALVAALPGVARDGRRATDVLVTIEVAAFVVGSAAGGLLLRPATQALVPWLPLVLVAGAAVVIAPVRMPRAVRVDGAPRVRAYAALRQAPVAARAIGLMALVNLVDSALALALLPLVLDRWGSDAAGYGLAVACLGFAGLAAPLMRLGEPPRSVVRGLVLVGLGVVVVVAAPGLGWSLAPLALVGSASVVVEAAATGVVQDALPDEVTATVLGVTDTVVVGAALVGALVAPPAVSLVGGTPVLVALGALALVPAAWGAFSTVETDVRLPPHRPSLDDHCPGVGAGVPGAGAGGLRRREQPAA